MLIKPQVAIANPVGGHQFLPRRLSVNAALSKSIVLVDDEKSYTDLMSQMLEENLDCKVTTFTRPLDALNALPTLKPAVVVTDYYMPQLNGLEFMRLASALAPNAAVVLITGHNLSAAEDQIRALERMKGFLAKPFGWRVLASEILRVWPDDVPAPERRANATLM